MLRMELEPASGISEDLQLAGPADQPSPVNPFKSHMRCVAPIVRERAAVGEPYEDPGGNAG
jgi:hypothetical protein